MVNWRSDINIISRTMLRMKSTLILLLICCSNQLSAQQFIPEFNPLSPKLPATNNVAIGCNIDSILQYRFINPTDSVISQKTIYNYYSDNSYSFRTIKPINNGAEFKVTQIDSFVLDAHYFWQNGTWLNAQKVTNSFDNLGNVAASTVYNWNGTEWVPYSEIVSTTSSNITETTQIEIATGLPLGRELVTTVPSGDTTTTEIQGWDAIAMAWKPGGPVTTIYYDDLDRIAEYFTIFMLPGVAYGNRVVYYYLGDTDCYSITEQFNYDVANNNFVFITRDFYFYPNTSNTQQLASFTSPLTVSPNPHNGWVQVTSTPCQPVEMYDLQGRLLRRFVSQGTDLVPVSGKTIIVRQGGAVRVLLGE